MHLETITRAISAAGIPAMAGPAACLAVLRAKFLSFAGVGRAVVCGVVCALAFGVPETRAAAPTAKEYEVKAAFLFNFAQFVEWPAEAFESPQMPVGIGILGDDPFGDILEQTIRGETVKGRPIVVHRSKQIENLKHCHLLFVGRSEKGRLAHIFAVLEGAHCLTVGETDQFARAGGIIIFRLQGTNIRFEINVDAARHSGLRISSKLLRLATIIGSERVKEGN